MSSRSKERLEDLDVEGAHAVADLQLPGAADEVLEAAIAAHGGSQGSAKPRDVGVHLAVAPHGTLDPAVMPEQINTPTSPGPDIWWVALFDGS